ncbi:hypothetical protein [Photorhabdus laumondii]|uniref:hypothetical protein n=1 Tax=Photorhabdus laumondii TaxID=2218628 RepID=UPI000D633104|nr:hypothetical protein [Photorhabdus laumondii]AWK42003.1 hypothetical protein A4R40_11140 [Photorhabdus laumondii subsp. laumondii]
MALYCEKEIINKVGAIEPSKYTLWISRCIAAARERIPGSIENYVTGVSECSQQRGNLKDDGYIPRGLVIALDTVKYTTLIKTLS